MTMHYDNYSLTLSYNIRFFLHLLFYCENHLNGSYYLTSWKIILIKCEKKKENNFHEVEME